jgi:uncharacterized protein
MTQSERIGQGITEIVGDKREAILHLAEQRGAYNVRVFGSVARGEATEESDLDLLVEFKETATLWDVVGLWQDLSALMEREVDVIVEEHPTDDFMRSALRDAIRL